MMLRKRSSRAQLVQRKHTLEGEINGLRAELRRQRLRGDDTTEVERRLARAQQRHYQIRLEIDRTARDS